MGVSMGMMSMGVGMGMEMTFKNKYGCKYSYTRPASIPI